MKNIRGHWFDTCTWSTENKQIQMLGIPYNTRRKTRCVANKHCTDDQSYGWKWEPRMATFITKTRLTVQKHKIMPKRFLWNDSGYHACHNVSDLLFSFCLANMTIQRLQSEGGEKRRKKKEKNDTNYTVCDTFYHTVNLWNNHKQYTTQITN